MNTTQSSIKKIVTLSVCGAMLLSATTSCNSFKKLTNEQKGAIIGIGAGAAAGAAIGSKSKNPAVYAIVGSAVGGVAGVFIGKYMDKQAAKMKKDLEGVAEVERIGEGIKLTMKSGILFGFDSYSLNQMSKDNLEKLAQTLKEYEDTNILVAGHTDNVGSEDYNMKLSEKRADAVADLLNNLGVKRSRMSVIGYGESAPVVDNTTESGRDKNRRVELAIVANDDLKKDAKSSSNAVATNNK
ncbi:OmpA family protein [Emticicia sp. BO119]|uniref:OmpA family protein n=1 Tax=Emticicia sp. BO119 TaxID=2757768 RepID=UPI0015F0CC7A|nr:OmpA family protein [Emticicia sp. BO119]MBA4854013.1 OmpA family protein [Emticicia sp. BO119]